MSRVKGYGSSPVKRRRRTDAELHQLDEAIITAVRTEYPVTVRGVYYRAVSAGAVDKTEQAYKTIVRRLGTLREDGQIPWDWISDGSRIWNGVYGYTNAAEAARATAQLYTRFMWQDLPDRVIVLSEKDAISGVIEPVTEELQVPLGIVRGFSSTTFCWRIYQEIIQAAAEGHPTFIYQLGDHDPSGVDAWRALRERVGSFLGDARSAVTFERIAVTPDQIEQFDLPTRPTKATDSRAKGFVGESVEVDAIAPTDLRDIVRGAIMRHVDEETLRINRAIEAEEINLLRRLGGAL